MHRAWRRRSRAATFVGAIAADYWIRRRRRDEHLRDPHVPYVVKPILATLDVMRPVRRIARQATIPPAQQSLTLDTWHLENLSGTNPV